MERNTRWSSWDLELGKSLSLQELEREFDADLFVVDLEREKKAQVERPLIVQEY